MRYDLWMAQLLTVQAKVVQAKDRDRPVDGEVTEAMVEAGVQEFGRFDLSLDDIRDALCAVYLCMREAARNLQGL